MEFGKHIKSRCVGFKAKEIGLATFGEFNIRGHVVDYGGDGIHVDGSEGLWVVVHSSWGR